MEHWRQAAQLARQQLLAARTTTGIWHGKLASSAVATAVAAFALGKVSPQDHKQVESARKWLVDNINADGGWGDTIASPSNLSAVLLCRAALLGVGEQTPAIVSAVEKSTIWLQKRIGGATPQHIIEGVLEFYGQDRTFSVPILTVCALSGMLGKKAWTRIPTLPFELAVLPHGFYSYLRLPVVSYAIPALIAVGIAQFKHAPSNALARLVRTSVTAPVLDKLARLLPKHGGFLEAAPLTGFVSSCLGCSGFADHLVVQKALSFLRTTMRSDGSWPIDTNLATWLTTLATKALHGEVPLAASAQAKIVQYLRETQFKSIHPFTQAQPGGWGWSHLPGAVPDADDTCGALVALALLSPQATAEVYLGLDWLLKLRNRDGGLPTFCRGWGLLPFDRSCPDISAHALQAFVLWLPHVETHWQRQLQKAIAKILCYLQKARDKDLVWTPLWFGDQNAPRQINRVYGTATVLECLATLPLPKVQHLTQPALAWLKNASNVAGGWGGEPETPVSIENTALAVAALALYDSNCRELLLGAEYLSKQFIDYDGLPPSSPIGLYFASLWYDEQLYPLLFGLRAFRNLLSRQR